MKILCVVGARPNFVKIAPLMKEIRKFRRIKPVLVHTGQHYDFKMSQIFFQELGIPKPDYNLGVGSGPHGWQTAKIMEKLEPIVMKEKPAAVIVVGDVNSTLAGALVAAKLNIPVIHIEAGLRSFDWKMPEEINRLLTDQITDYLFVTEPSAIKNLLREGISRRKIFYVGNIMIDSLVSVMSKITASPLLNELNLKKGEYAVLTLHRPSNVDDLKSLSRLLEIFSKIQEKIKIVWPVHPRAKKQIKKIVRLKGRIAPKLFLIDPLSYLDFSALQSNAKFVITDSGGIQEETTFLKIPCLTLRENTERPITVSQGTNTIVGQNKNRILEEVGKILNNKNKKSRIPKYWDGQTAKRIVKVIYKLVSKNE